MAFQGVDGPEHFPERVRTPGFPGAVTRVFPIHREDVVEKLMAVLTEAALPLSKGTLR
jgi:hypothetical protein